MSGIAPGPDPLPWRHVDGDRVSDPGAEGAPVGGFTYDPRPGCSDYADRYISTRDQRIDFGSAS